MYTYSHLTVPIYDFAPITVFHPQFYLKVLFFFTQMSSRFTTTPNVLGLVYVYINQFISFKNSI